MAQNTLFQMPVNEDLLRQASEVLSLNFLTVPGVVQALLAHIVQAGGLPPGLEISPEVETERLGAAIQESLDSPRLLISDEQGMAALPGLVAMRSKGEFMSSGARLLDTIALDLLQFGHGDAFDASRVSKFLNLQKLDVSRLAGVPVRLVRYGAEMPGPVRECLEEVAGVVRMVAQVFDGDSRKTKAWFNAINPMLGDISPIDMIRLGRLERLRRFVLGAIA